MKIDFEKMLSGGDRRTIGRSEEATEAILAAPVLIPDLLLLVEGDDPLLRSRAAHALRHAAAKAPEILAPYKNDWLKMGMSVNQWEVREQFCIALPLLPLTTADIEKVFPTLQAFLDDRSSIVRTCAMQAMVDLTERQPFLKATVEPIIRELTETGTAAMRARGRKLLKRL